MLLGRFCLFPKILDQVEDCERVRINGADGIQSHTDDPGNDLTLLSTKESRSGIATIRIGRARIGESVAVAGFPLHGLLSGLNFTTGTKGLGNDARFYQITAPVQPGNSGGPLIDATGNVLGVVESKFDAVKVAEVTGDIPQNVNFALNANTLQSFLEANGVDFGSGSLSNTLSTADIAARAKQYTVLVECWK